MYIIFYHFKLSTVCPEEQMISICFRFLKLSVIRESACVLTSYEYLNASHIFSLPILQNLFILTYNVLNFIPI